ncbi:hypothetical protein OROMI_006967 [Orobanche minor]
MTYRLLGLHGIQRLCAGRFLIGSTLAVLLTITLGTSMAALQGPVVMTAHQICLQLWRAVSLLTDALVASSQALIAGYVSKDEYKTVNEITQLVLKVGCVTGVSPALILGVSFGSLDLFLQRMHKSLELLEMAL